MNFGQRLRNPRTEKGMTLPELADKTGLSKGFLSQLENEQQTNPSLDTLKKIADVFGITLAELLQKDSVKAKRIVPDTIDPSLKECLDEMRHEGLTPNEDVLQAIFAVQHRKGTQPKTKSDWRYLYDSIERWMKNR